MADKAARAKSQRLGSPDEPPEIVLKSAEEDPDALDRRVIDWLEAEQREAG